MNNATFLVVDYSQPLCKPCDMSFLREAREAQGLTQEQLAEMAGTTRMNIYRLEKRDGISRKWAEKLSPILNVPIEDLLLGKPASLQDQQELVRTNDQFTSIPIRGEVAAGLWREVDDMNQDLEPLGFEMTIAIPDYPAELQFGLRVRGESLNKIAPNGSTLHCLEFINGGA